jgi:hypothetical protein
MRMDAKQGSDEAPEEWSGNAAVTSDMDLVEYRNSEREQARVRDLVELLPIGHKFVLDVGARDGFISKLLVDHFSVVTALDLEQLTIEHERIQCVQGDITALDFPDATFDLVFCAEVLEHLPTHLLKTACLELARVSKDYVLIGVPYRQDIRVGRTTCNSCGKANPPWGHVNTFDQIKLAKLFPEFSVAKESFVGMTDSRTNNFSRALLDIAGNPYGTYSQEEPCIHCGKKLSAPPARTFAQKVATRAAYMAMKAQSVFVKPQPIWIHQLLRK